MQTFLPTDDLSFAGKYLDQRRLNKQITECAQILQTLLFDGGWRHHPAVLMWKGYEEHLICYANGCFNAFTIRGGSIMHRSYYKLVDLYLNHFHEVSGCNVRPPWLGDPELHSSHRARLLHKGNIDTLRKRLKLFLTNKDYTVDLFCQNYFESSKKLLLRDLNVTQCFELHEYLNLRGITQYDSWYEQWGWEETPGDLYYWPLFESPLSV